MILLEKRFRNYAHLIAFADSAVPYHKTVAQLIPGKSGVNGASLSGGDSPAVPYLLTISDTERLAQSAPFIRVKSV